jgi:hypothetical protein
LDGRPSSASGSITGSEPTESDLSSGGFAIQQNATTHGTGRTPSRKQQNPSSTTPPPPSATLPAATTKAAIKYQTQVSMFSCCLSPVSRHPLVGYINRVKVQAQSRCKRETA